MTQKFEFVLGDEKIGVRVNCGCFDGTIDEFAAQIESTHKKNEAHLKQYRAFLQLIRVNFE